MISFASDYTTGAHPEILKRFSETNYEHTPGYGEDRFCASAAEKIKEACGLPDSEVFFLTGGTQTNQVVISTLLKPFQGVIAGTTGHINCHEAGAIEYTGHKVLEVPAVNGKICAEDINDYIETFYQDASFPHMVYPGMVYISHPTEYGTLYTKNELEEIYAVCREYHIPLFIDGARLAYGLASFDTDVTLKDLASLCDVFYIGGTKCGALCGEAVVFTKGNLPEGHIAQIKQHGALLAKGRLLGIQFDVLFENNLYMELGRHAIEMAESLKAIFEEKGYEFFIDSPTNQQFIIMPDSKLEELSKKVVFSFWEKYDENKTVVRFATSWSTTEEDLRYLNDCL